MLKALLDSVEGGRALLSKSELHHLVRVRRARHGEIFLGLDRAKSGWYRCRLERNQQGWEVQVVETLGCIGEPALEIVLASALVQKHAYEWVLQKSCELGVSEIVPLMTRNVAEWSRRKVERLAPRWEKILVESVKQCGRSRVPTLSNTRGVAEFLELSAGSPVIALHPESRLAFPEVGRRLQQPGKLALMIGPEGGWDAEELSLLETAGAWLVRLGPRAMRAETAALAGLSMLQSVWGDFAS